MTEPMISEVAADGKPCPVCPDELGIETMVEPEVDGEHLYYECGACGYAFGWEKVEETTRIEGNCSIGVPESVRRRASAPMEQALWAEQESQPVLLGSTIGRRPE